MESAKKVYQIMEIISEKARRKELRQRIYDRLGMSRENFYRKMRAKEGGYRFAAEEEKIIAAELGVSLNEIFNPQIDLQLA